MLLVRFLATLRGFDLDQSEFFDFVYKV